MQPAHHLGMRQNCDALMCREQAPTVPHFPHCSPNDIWLLLHFICEQLQGFASHNLVPWYLTPLIQKLYSTTVVMHHT